MQKINTAPVKKLISAVLSAIILLQANIPAFSSEFSYSFATDAAAVSDAGKIDEAFLRGEEDNPYEHALNLKKNAAVKAINDSAAKKALASLKATGQAKKGALWPIYVEATGQKHINALEEKVKQALGEILAKPAAMPYKSFKKEYEKELLKYAKNYVRENNVQAQPPFKKPEDKIHSDLLAALPADKAYEDYKKDARAEAAWREQNKNKVEEAAYQVARAGVKAIGAENLSFNFAALLLGITLNGKTPLTQTEKTAIYNYHVTRLEKQQFDIFDFGLLSGDSQKKTAARLLVNIIRSVSMPAQLPPPCDAARYAKAVENLIYRSQDTAAFGQVLGSGFAALLAKGDYSALDRILNRYTQMENDSGSWGDWLSLVHYANLLNGDKYLGPASIRTQYNTDYVYANTFTDIALLLAENGSAQSKQLLYKYGTGKDVKTVIKPFLKGALTGANSGAQANTAEAKAAALANMDFGDISAIYEYDIDSQLLRKYPNIAGKLNKNAVTTKERRQAKSAHQKRFAYLQRAAKAGDIYLIVYGFIGLAKLGKGAVTLSKSTYSAIKASRIRNSAQRIAYIRANYGQMAKYVSVKRSFMRLGTNVKIALKKPVDPRRAFKLENAKNAQKLSALETQAAAARETAQASGKAKDIARADYVQAQYNMEKARVGVGLQLRGDGARSFLSKYTAYLNGDAGLLGTTFTAEETGFLKALGNYSNSMRDVSAAAANYYPHLNVFQRGFLYTYGKLNYWFTKFNPFYWRPSAGAGFFAGGSRASAAAQGESEIFTGAAAPSPNVTTGLTFTAYKQAPITPTTTSFPEFKTSLFKPQINWSLAKSNLSFVRPEIAAIMGSAVILNPFSVVAETKFFDYSHPTTRIESSEAPILSTIYGKYDAQVLPLFKHQIDKVQNLEFEVNGQDMTVTQMLQTIEAQYPESGITLARYQRDMDALEALAPQLTPVVFDKFLKSLSNGEILKKILSSKSKKAQKKLPELFEKYNNSLSYFEAYRRAATPFFTPVNPSLPRVFYHVPEFPSAEGFTQSAVDQSLEQLDGIEFSKRLVKSLFSSRNLIENLQGVLSQSTTRQALQLSAKITDLHYEVNALVEKGIAKRSIKGCIIDAGKVWDATIQSGPFNPERIGLSVEFQFDASMEIVQWMHKNGIPLENKEFTKARRKGQIPQEVSDNLLTWIKSQIGISEERPAHYVETVIEDGSKEVHVYNNDYTARIRLGKHELSIGNPHLHLEYLENGEWYGIRNHSYAFNVETPYLQQANSLLQSVQNHFKPAKKPDLATLPSLTPPPGTKALYILGGPNASGKTRIFNALLADQKLPFLNQDIIAAERNISDMEAGKILLSQMDEMFRDGRSFIFESTLSGRGVTSYIRKAKENGYKVMILYTFVKDAQTSIARAASRVLEGGHAVPYGDLTQRYIKSRNNFWNLYKDMADDWIMFFNGDADIVPIASKSEGAPMKILDEALFSEHQPLGPLTE